MELPQDLTEQLRPAFPALTRLLRSFAEDPRESLDIDNVLLNVYYRQGTVPKRPAITQQLHEATRQGLLARLARGRYALTDSGRARLQELLSLQISN